ncbi:MAG: tetratricopeptide repeat protein, partial [Proteobacteria bacterium]|nr:tetratricopeptide repeat protein [Pseudomonadota bacterium]
MLLLLQKIFWSAIHLPATSAAIGKPTTGSSVRTTIKKNLNGLATSSVVVLPFKSEVSSAQDAQDYAARITNDLIDTLSLVPSFRVVARATLAHLSDQKLDLAALRRDLGVEYAVEGTIQETVNTLRVNLALIDLDTGLRVWADRYEVERGPRPIEPEHVVRGIARQLHNSIMDVRGSRPGDGSTDSKLTEMLHKAWAAHNRFAFVRGGEEAGQLFKDVLAIDPDNVSALTGLGAFTSSLAFRTPRSERKAIVDEAEGYLKHALERDPQASVAHYFMGQVAILRGDAAEALARFERTISINPSYAPAYGQKGLIQLSSGRHQEALELVQYAMRLSPKDRYLGLWSSYLGRIHFELG